VAELDVVAALVVVVLVVIVTKVVAWAVVPGAVVELVVADPTIVAPVVPPDPAIGVPVAVIAEVDCVIETAPLYRVGPGTT